MVDGEEGQRGKLLQQHPFLPAHQAECGEMLLNLARGDVLHIHRPQQVIGLQFARCILLIVDSPQKSRSGGENDRFAGHGQFAGPGQKNVVQAQ